MVDSIIAMDYPTRHSGMRLRSAIADLRRRPGISKLVARDSGFALRAPRNDMVRSGRNRPLTPSFISSLRGAKRRSNPVFAPHSGLLRSARNDDFKQPQRSRMLNVSA